MFSSGTVTGANVCSITPCRLNSVKFQKCRFWAGGKLAKRGLPEIMGRMLRVNFDKWDHTPEMLRLFALEAPHPRTRERMMALYEVSQGTSATQIASKTGRHDQTVHRWIHQYNDQGVEALLYRRTGGRPPFVRSFKRT